MEQEGYYFRVGLFVAISLVVAVVVIGWFAGRRDEIGKTTYAIYMKGAVNGLSLGAPVTLGGIEVGNVTDISFASSEGVIRVLANIVDTAPVRTDTVASLQLQGITGTSQIGLENMGNDPAPITRRDKDGFRIIASKPSPLERVFTSIPQLIDQLTELAQRAQVLLDDKNVAAVHEALTQVNDLLAESKGTVREVKMLTHTLREDPSIVLYGTQHPGVKVP